MFCKNCGCEIKDSSVFCPNCGYECQPVNTETQQQNQFNAQENVGGYTQPYQQPQPVMCNQPAPDKVSVGMCILSVLIPLVGIIYFFVKRKETPKKAKGALLSGLISAGVNILLSIIITISMFSMLGNAFDPNNWDENLDYEITINGEVVDSDENEDEDIYEDIDDNDVMDNEDNEDVDIPSSSSGTMSSYKLTDYKIEINGAVYDFPISYADFAGATGAAVTNKYYTDTTLAKNYYNTLPVELSNGMGVTLYIINTDTDGEISYKDCDVFGFRTDRYDLYGYGSDISFDDRLALPGNIRIGISTKEDVIAAYGEATDVYEGDTLCILTYELSDELFNDSQAKIDIDVETNTVTAITYRNENF